MSSLVLVRFAHAPFGTYGILYAGSQKFYTVEQPWRMNERMRSCVPEGKYQIINHNSAKYPNSFALVNHQLGVYYQPGPGVPENARKAILIHPGNVPADLAGCIAPGTSIGYTRDTWAVLNSKVAMDAIRKYIKDNQVKNIVITHVDTNKSVDAIPTYAQNLSG